MNKQSEPLEQLQFLVRIENKTEEHKPTQGSSPPLQSQQLREQLNTAELLLLLGLKALNIRSKVCS